MIRVAIADDEVMLRSGLRDFLSDSKDIELIGEAANGQEACDCVERYQPGVLLMDIDMPVMNGLEAARQIRDLPVLTRVILMSANTGAALIKQVAAIGAQGFIAKNELMALLPTAILAVYLQGQYFE